MILNTSAVLAILFAEDDATRYVDAMAEADGIYSPMAEEPCMGDLWRMCLWQE